MSYSDKELLELAAKAAGMKLLRIKVLPCGFTEAVREGFNPNGGNIWNPLHSDADVFRLTVQLDIDLSFYTDKEAKVYAQTKHLLGYGTDGYASYQAHEYHKELYEGSDPYAATRRAIVRAAAAIGDAMA